MYSKNKRSKRSVNRDSKLQSVNVEQKSMDLKLVKTRSSIAAKLQLVQGGTSTRTSSNRTKNPTKWCPHCDCVLTIKTFKRHRSLYFNPRVNKWLKAEGLSESAHGASTTGLYLCNV